MPSGESPRRTSRLRPLVPALVTVVIAAVLIGVVAVGEGDDGAPAAVTSSTTVTTTAITAPTDTTTTTIPAPVPVESLLVDPPAVEEPTAYRITYDVVENGLGRVEEWTVRRPYESLVLSTRDGTLLTGTSTSREVLQQFLSDERGWLPLQPELHRAAYDQHPAAAVPAMEALGLVERAGEAEYLGRRCTTWRTGQPPSAGPPTVPSDEEQTELCIDDAGLVLHERWSIGGSVVVERTATALELEPDVDTATFQPGPVAEDAEALQGAFTTIAVEADQETLDRLRTEVTLPTGYVADGAVFRAGGAGAGGQAGSSEIVRFYSSGPDLLEVSEVFVDGPATITAAAGAPVEIEGWEEAWFEPGFVNSFLRGRIDGTSFVEVRHHDVRFLFEVFATLTPRGG